MDEPWLSDDQLTAWLKLLAVVELLPGQLDSQLRRDADLTLFDYQVLAMLSEAPGRTLRMTALAHRTNATLPRLSHVAKRLEQRGFVERLSCADDGRATNVRLTAGGWDKIVATAPGHVRAVRRAVSDALTDEQVAQLDAIADAILDRIDPHHLMTAHAARPGLHV